MKYFSDLDILRSICLSIFFGVFLSCIFIASESVRTIIKKILYLPANTASLLRNFKRREIVRLSRNEIYNKKSSRANNVYDFITFLIFGLLTVVHFYVTLDGVFRVYVILIVICSFIVFKKTVGALFELLIAKTFVCAYTALLFFLGLTLLPMYKTVKFMTKIIYKRIEPIKQKYLFKKSKKTVSRKLTEVRKLSENKDIRTVCNS